MMDHARSRLPVLAGLAREAAPRRKARSFVVTHVLGTSVPYLDIIHRTFPIEAVLAIPYSAEMSSAGLAAGNAHDDQRIVLGTPGPRPIVTSDALKATRIDDIAIDESGRA